MNDETRRVLRARLQQLVESAAMVASALSGGGAGDAMLSGQAKGSPEGFTVMHCDGWETALAIASRTLVAIHAGQSSGHEFVDRADMALTNEEFVRSIEALTK